MSRADYESSVDAFRSLAGRPFTLTAAANSLKLCFDPPTHRAGYLWVDPPWVLEDPAGSVVADAADCPMSGSAFREWAAKLDAVRGAALSMVRHVPELGTVIELSNGYRLCVLESGKQKDEESWYDDFYWRE